MEIINLIKCEFIKNFSIKKIIIIIFLLILSCLAIIKIDDYGNGYKYRYSHISIDVERVKNDYYEAKSKEIDNPNFINKTAFEIFEKLNDYLVLLEDAEPWEYDAYSMLENYASDEIIIKNLIENYNSQEIKNIIERNNDKKDEITYSNSNYESKKNLIIFVINKKSNKTLEELKKEYEEIKEKEQLVFESMKNNLYYEYILSNCGPSIKAVENYSQTEKNRIEEYCNYYEKEKIESQYDYRAINTTMYSALSTYVDTRTNYNKEAYAGSIDELNTEEATQRYLKKDLERAKAAKNIAYYSFKNNLKNDISYSNNNIDYMGNYKTSKTIMNNGLHLGPIILLIVIITNAGIMSKEHDKNTIKLLLTKPVKRYKILLSKLLYLITITFAMWLVVAIIMFFISGFTSGFNELFTSKIIATSTSARETNYLLWYLKEIILGMIPITFFITLLFSLSTLTLSTSVTASITSIITLLSMLTWSLIAGSHAYILSFLNYTPLPWINYRAVTSSNIYYLKAISQTKLNDSYGLIISIICTILLFLLTAFVYNKKDIKS